MRRILPILLLLGPAAALAQPAAPQTVLPGGTYVFSDFCAGSKFWDIAGHRVEFRHWGGDNDTVIIEFSEYGGDTGAIIANRLHFDPITGALDFVYQTQIDEYTFKGFVTETALRGTFEDEQFTTTLPGIKVDSPLKAKCPVITP